MSFGWAYVGCDDIAITSMTGPSGSILCRTGTYSVSGSDHYKLLAQPAGGAQMAVVLTGSMYIKSDNSAPNALSVDGNVTVDGNITANSYNVVSTTVTEVEAQGSTTFGNGYDDRHTLSGSFVIKGDHVTRPVLSVTGSSNAAENKLGILTNQPTNTLSVSGSVGLRYDTSGDATVTMNGDLTDATILGISRDGAVTVKLPVANDQPGRVIYIKDECTTQPRVSGKKITIEALNGTDLIDGHLKYYVMGSRAAISLYSNGSDAWFVF